MRGGYEVLEAGSAEQAVELLKKERPELIISDVVMPGLGGFGLFKAVRADENIKSIPFVVLTTRGKMRDTFLALGADEVLSKPFETDALLARVREFFPGDEPVPVVKEVLPSAGVQVKETAAPQEQVPAESVSAAAAEEAVCIPRAKRVLLAGKTPLVLERMREHLERKRWQHLVVLSGAEILNEAVQFEPDMVMLDVLMMGVATKEIIRKMRKSPELKFKRIVTFSYVDKEDNRMSSHQWQLDIESSRTACLEAGADEFIGHFEEQGFSAVLDRMS